MFVVVMFVFLSKLCLLMHCFLASCWMPTWRWKVVNRFLRFFFFFFFFCMQLCFSYHTICISDCELQLFLIGLSPLYCCWLGSMHPCSNHEEHPTSKQEPLKFLKDLLSNHFHHHPMAGPMSYIFGEDNADIFSPLRCLPG